MEVLFSTGVITAAADMDPERSSTTAVNKPLNRDIKTLQKFCRSVNAYCQDSSSEDDVQKQLEALSGVETSVFTLGDPVSLLNFYNSLRNLLSVLEVRGFLAWSAISVLETAVHCNSTRKENSVFFDFIPVLSRFLQESLILEKKVRLLKLLETLSYGIKIKKQEAYLHKLLTTVSHWAESGESDLTLPALVVLVNLLHRNPVVVSTFMRDVDTKQFCRSILRMTVEPSLIYEVKKLVFLLPINSQTESDFIHKFVESTFLMLSEAVEVENVLQVHHCVEFFSDVVETVSLASVSSYDYMPGIRTLLEFLKTIQQDCNADCKRLLLKFFTILVKFGIPGLSEFYSEMVDQALLWVKWYKRDSSEAFALLHSILVAGRNVLEEHVFNNCLNKLHSGIGEFLLPLLKHTEETSIVENNEDFVQFTAFFELLDEGLKISTLRSVIIQNLDLKVLESFFLPLSLEPRNQHSTISKSQRTFYVRLMYFICHVVRYECAWQKWYSDQLRDNGILVIFALTLGSGTTDERRSVLELIGTLGFPQESIDNLAKIMGDLDSSHPFSVNTSVSSSSLVEPDSSPSLYPYSARHSIKKLVDRLSNLSDNDMIQDVDKCELIEILEAQQEMNLERQKAMENSLSATSNEMSTLRNHCTRILTEVSKLQEQLYASERSLKDTKSDYAALTRKFEEMEEDAERKFLNYAKEVAMHQLTEKQLSEDLQITKKVVDEKRKKIKETKELMAQQSKHIGDLENQLTEATRNHSDLLERVNRAEEKELGLEKTISKLQGEKDNLEKEVAELEEAAKRHLARVAEREREMGDMEQKLTELERLKNTIYELSAGMKKF